MTLAGCGSISKHHKSVQLAHKPALTQVPAATRLSRTSRDVYEAVFEMSASSVTSVNLSLNEDYRDEATRFQVPNASDETSESCDFPSCNRVELPGRPPAEITRWLAIVDHWWKVRAGRSGVQFKSMQRSLRDQTNDAILFRQSIMETTQIQPSGDVSCILRRKIYLESDNEHGSRMARELARFRRRHGLPNPVIESPIAPWSGDGVIRSTQSGKQHRLELHYGLVHPDPSGGQFMSTSMVCTAKHPIWAGSMGSIHVRRGSNPFSTTVDYRPMMSVENEPQSRS